MKNKCLGIFLVVITIPLVILSIYCLASFNFFKSQYYKDLFKKSNTYALAVKAVPQNNTNGTDNLMLTIQSNLTPIWLEQNTTKNLDIFFGFINGQKPNLDISIDIRPFKKDFFANAPAETQNILPDDIGISTYVKFLSDIKNLSTANPAVAGQTNIPGVDTQVLDAQNLAKQVDQNAALIKKGYTTLKIVIYIILGLTLLMLIIIGLVSRHWLPAVFRWIGVTLFIPGLLTFASSLMINYLVKYFDLMSKINVAANIKTLVSPLYNNIISDLINNSGKISLIFVIVGLIFMIISYILPKYIPQPTTLKSQPKPSTPAPALANPKPSPARNVDGVASVKSS